MAKKSAGILAYRFSNGKPEFLLGHPGGPYHTLKDLGAWSIPKGEFTDEVPLAAAVREFEEETGFCPAGDFIELTPIRQAGGKDVYAFAIQYDLDPGKLVSNTFEIEWPPHSGRRQSFPEIDKAEWFTADVALLKINPKQAALINELLRKLGFGK